MARQSPKFRSTHDNQDSQAVGPLVRSMPPWPRVSTIRMSPAEEAESPRSLPLMSTAKVCYDTPHVFERIPPMQEGSRFEWAIDERGVRTLGQSTESPDDRNGATGSNIPGILERTSVSTSFSHSLQVVVHGMLLCSRACSTGMTSRASWAAFSRLVETSSATRWWERKINTQFF